MITFNLIDDKRIVGSVNGESFSTPYSKELWEKMVKANEKLAKASSMEEAKLVIEEFKELTVEPTKESTIQEITPLLMYNRKKNTYHLKYGGKVSPVALPETFIDKMKYAHEKDLPVTPIVKLLLRAFQNPRIVESDDPEVAEDFLRKLGDYVSQTFVDTKLAAKFVEEGHSEEVAEKMATLSQTPITNEGLLCLKKVVTPLYDRQRFEYVFDENGNPAKKLRNTVSQDLDADTGKVTINDPVFAEDWVFEPAIMGSGGEAFYLGEGPDAKKGHILKVGQLIRLESWDSVDCDDNRVCSKGLHCGNFDYIRGFQSSSNATVLVFVDPAKIGAIPVGDNSGTIRMLEQFIYGFLSTEVANKNLYHSSTYAAQKDAEWEEYKAAAIEKYQKELEEVKTKVETKIENLW